MHKKVYDKISNVAPAGAGKIPEEIYAIAAFLFIFSETARTLAKQSGEFILDQVKELIDGVKKFIEYIISLLKEMYENLKPPGTVVVQLISSMLLSAGMYRSLSVVEMRDTEDREVEEYLIPPSP